MKKIMLALIVLIATTNLMFAGITQCKVYNTNSTVKLTSRLSTADREGWVSAYLELDKPADRDIRVRVCFYDLDDQRHMRCESTTILKGKTSGSIRIRDSHSINHDIECTIDTATCD